jgi:hypothetical protein
MRSYSMLTADLGSQEPITRSTQRNEGNLLDPPSEGWVHYSRTTQEPRDYNNEDKF